LGEKQTLNRKANRFGPAPPLVLPPGHTKEDLKTFLRNVVIGGQSSDELLQYADSHLDRFLYTLGLVPGGPQKALEIGADPYFFTLLLRKFCNLELSLTNFVGSSRSTGVQEVIHTEFDGEKCVERLEFCNVNMETEKLPFPECHFDLVFFCEVLEHLQLDPLHAMLEIKRVLKIGGTLILTTPNAVGIERIAKLLVGQNVCDHYSAYGPYGRHNREYSPEEVRAFMRYSGLQPKMIFTAGYRSFSNSPPWFLIQLLKFLGLCRKGQLGSVIYAVSRKLSGGPSAYYQSTLDTEGREIRLSGDVRELSGFFDLEFDGMRYFRWSGRESILTLYRRPGQNFLFLLVGSPNVGKPRTLEIIAGGDRSVSIKTGWRAYLVPIFDKATDCGEIRLVTDPTFRTEGDERELGIMLASAIVLDEPPLKKPNWLYRSYSEVETDCRNPESY
jgi:SAM-dependent methyltransferase